MYIHVQYFFIIKEHIHNLSCYTFNMFNDGFDLAIFRIIHLYLIASRDICHINSGIQEWSLILFRWQRDVSRFSVK